MSPKSSSEEPLSSDLQAFEVPTWYRWISSLIGLVLLGFPIVFLLRYSMHPGLFVSPADLGLVPMILAGTMILLVSLAPWKGLGIWPRKVGVIEFDRIVSTQAREHAEELAEIRVRIDEIESKVRGLDEISSITENFEDLEIRPLVSKFLEQNRPTAFSPLRIREWGSRQAGFEKLSSVRVSSIRRILQSMVATGNVATRVSRLGNTLYKVAD